MPSPPRQTPLRLHRRQFLLAPRPIAVAEGWVSEALGPGLHLHRCPELRVERTADAEGRGWLLLGRAIETDPDRPAPLASLAAVPSTAVPALSHDWAGRWLLIGPLVGQGGRIFPDASALLGCLYCRDAEGALWVSSSPALLAEHAAGVAQALGDPRTLTYNRGVSWYPPPRARFAAMHRLLPSQALRLLEGRVEARALMPPIDPAWPPEAARAELARRLVAVLRRLAAETGEPPWLGLTGGYDSRLMLALAAQAGLPLQPFTRVTPRMTVADRVLPPALARIAGYPHRLTFPAAVREDRRALLRRHAADHVSKGDARPVLSGERDDLTGISIGGHGFAIAGGFADWRALPAEPVPAAAAVEAFLQRAGEPAGSPAAAGLAGWLAWIRETPQPHLDWRDRLYLEQRQAGWLAAKEQVSDLNAVERFPILNSARLYALILGIDVAARRGSELQRDLIATALPALLSLPFNPPDRAFLRSRPDLVLRRRVFRAAGRWWPRLSA
ncbi:hypothetical protein [Pelagibius sp.]|uniref:hypothetical protein n=1 Tax=Pelagibius sp. TaxID=1931238 RepID=UPI0026320452|nr:hypothetical protein [Pelagibius sp.]